MSYFQDPGGWISYLGFTLSFTASAIVGATWGAMALSLSTLPLSVLCDFGVVAVERRLMGRGAALDSAVTIVTILAINAAIVIVVLSVPLIVNALLPGYTRLQLAALGLPLTSLFTILVVVLYILVAIALLMHRLLWPVLQHPIYALARWRVINNSKLLAGSGMALLAVASNSAALFLQSMLKHVGLGIE